MGLPALYIRHISAPSSGGRGLSVECGNPGGITRERLADRLVLYPGGKSCRIKQWERVGPDLCTLQIKGATRSELSSASLLLPESFEQYVSSVAVCLALPAEGDSPDGRTVPPAGSYVVVDPVPGNPALTAKRSGHGLLQLAGRNELPFVPGSVWTLERETRGKDSSPVRVRVRIISRAEAEAVALWLQEHVGAGWREETLSGEVLSLLHYQLHGFVGTGPGCLLEPSLSLPEDMKPLEIGTWRVNPGSFATFERELERTLLSSAGMSRAIFLLLCRRIWPGAREAFAQRLAEELERRGQVSLVKGRVVAPRKELESRLSPAEATLFSRIKSAGTAGLSFDADFRDSFRELAEKLAARGAVTLLDNGRAFSREAMEDLARTIFQETDENGEIHIRRLARALGVTRGAAEAVAMRLARDGKLAKVSVTVYRENR